MSEVMGTILAKSPAIVFVSENRRNVTFIQNQENLFRTSAFLKIIRIKFWRRLYPWNLTLNAMRLLPWSCYVDFMEISTFWQNSEAEIQRNRFCKSSSDGKEQLNRKQHTLWDFLVPIPCLLYESINNKSSKMCPKISCFWKILPIPRIPPFGQPETQPWRRVLRTTF